MPKHSNQSRARETSANRPEREDGVTLIIEAMTSGEYIRGRTDKELAKRWGMGVASVQQWTAEAARRIRSAISDDEIRARVEMDVERITDLAEQNGEYSAALKGHELLLNTRGMLRQKLDVRVSPEQLSEEQLRAELLKHGLEVKELGE